tara:strand:- start:104 stop:436 length:333 start_codon:yes stop_codon:yes gene_type:complete
MVATIWREEGETEEDSKGYRVKPIKIHIIAGTFSELIAAIDEIPECNISFTDPLMHEDSPVNPSKGFNPVMYEGTWEVTIEASDTPWHRDHPNAPALTGKVRSYIQERED